MSTTTETGDGLGRDRLVVLIGLMLAVLMGALDQTIVSAALPKILSSLGAGTDKITWIVSSYLITMAASMPLYGRLSDMYGRKSLFEFSIILFWVGSGLCGVAQNVGQLAFFRALQGIGGGGLIGLATTIIGDIFSPRERGQYVSLMFVIIGFSNVLGPLLGGWLTDTYTWRLIFAINLPIGLVALAIIEPALDLPIPDEDHTIDLLGVLFLFTTTVSIVFISEWGGSDYDWNSWQIRLLMLVALVATVLFLYQELTVEEPILPLELFKNPVVAGTIGLSFLIGVGRILVISYVPTFLQYTRGVSATRAGFLISPMIVGMVGVSFVVGQLLTRTGRYKPFPVIGSVVGAVGFYFLSTIHGTTSFLVLSLYLGITGAGFGFIMPVLTTAAQNAVDPEYLGSVTTVLSYLRSLAGALGVSILGTVFSNELASRTFRLGGRMRSRSNLNPVMIHTPKVGRALRWELIDAVSKSIDTMFLYVVPVMVLALIVSLLLPEWELSQETALEAATEESTDSSGPRSGEPTPTDD